MVPTSTVSWKSGWRAMAMREIKHMHKVTAKGQV
jgi:hypothetical protein